MVKTEEEVNVKHFNKNQYDEAKAYQMSYNDLSSFLQTKYDFEEITSKIIRNKKKIKPGKNGKILKNKITAPLFDIASDCIKIANNHFQIVKTKLFNDIANEYKISLQIELLDGTRIDNPSVKSVSSFADRIYRNIMENKGSNPTVLKDWIRGTFIFKIDNIQSVSDIVDKLKKYIENIDIKNHPAYKGIHLNLIYNNVPVEIQLHTKNSWKLKTESDLFYDKWRSFKYSKLDQNQKDEYTKQENLLENKWSQMLEERDFHALRAEASSVKNSMSSSLGSNSQPYTSSVGLDQDPSTNSNNSSSAKEPLNNRPVGVNTNPFSLNPYSSFDSNIIASDSGNINNGPPPNNNNLPGNDLIRREPDLSRKIRVGQGIRSSSKFIDNVNGQFESFVVKFVNGQYANERAFRNLGVSQRESMIKTESVRIANSVANDSVLNGLSKINPETQKVNALQRAYTTRKTEF